MLLVAVAERLTLLLSSSKYPEELGDRKRRPAPGGEGVREGERGGVCGGEIGGVEGVLDLLVAA